MSENGWTIGEAVTVLDPPMTVAEVRALVTAFAVPQVGQRRGGVGRPAPTYDAAQLLQAHAVAVVVRTGHAERVLPVAPE